MDAAGIDFAILALTSPGVPGAGSDTAVALARDSNDMLSEAVTRHPDRYAALCAIAPQAPELAAKEMELQGTGFQGDHQQFAYTWRVSVRSEILANF